jgi:uncharacterized membrane protein (UPF0127 family)
MAIERHFTVLPDNFSMKPSQASHSGAIRRQLLTFAVAVSTAVAAASTWAQNQPQLDLQRTPLGVGMHRIDAQVALTPEQRQVGLMWRQSMPAHEGMLFVFEQASQQCFWMKNTLIPLTAAFLDDDGTIVNLADMKPQTTDTHCSAKPVRYVLEMNVGWFAKKNIKAGAKIQGLPQIR